MPTEPYLNPRFAKVSSIYPSTPMTRRTSAVLPCLNTAANLPRTSIYAVRNTSAPARSNIPAAKADPVNSTAQSDAR